MESLQQLAVLTGHSEDRIWHLSWSPNGRYLATSGEDKVIRIWCADSSSDAANNNNNNNNNSSSPWTQADQIKCIATLEDAQQRTIRSCEWSPDGRMIASASFDGTIVIWECQNRMTASASASGGNSASIGCTKWEQISSLEGHENEVKGVAWSADGELIATCGRDKKIWVWERSPSNDFECVALLSEHTQDVKFVTWHPTKKVLFSTSYDDSIKVWSGDDVDSSDEWRCIDTLTGHNSTVWSLCIDKHQGHRIVSCSDDLSIALWENNNSSDICNGKWMMMAVLKNLHNFPIYSVNWLGACDSGLSHDIIVSGSADNSIALCTIERDTSGMPSLQLSYRLENAHKNDINCVRWRPINSGKNSSDSSSDDYILASCGDDGAIRIYRLVVK